MKFSFSSFLIILITPFMGCHKKADLTQNEIYKILNEIIADDSLNIHTVCWQVDYLQISNDYGFSKEDRHFIKRQNKIFRDFKIEPNRLRAYSKKEKAYRFVLVDTNCKEGIVRHLSFPLISADRQKVLIGNTEDCNCMLGGQGVKNLYIKRNGHWKKIKSFDRWVSQNERSLKHNERPLYSPAVLCETCSFALLLSSLWLVVTG